MKKTAITVLLAGFVAGNLGAGEIQGEWPSYLGANNAFSETSGAKLIDGMTKVKFVWESEEKGIGFGKAVSSAGKTGYAEGTGLAYGGEASPIVAAGLVVQFYTVPCGETTWAQGEQIMGAKFKDFTHFWKISADEIVIAMDAATGKTRWKRVFADKGINSCPGKRGGFAVTPCAAGGKVFAFGTTARLYCLDLATGKMVWESAIEPIHKAFEDYKAKGLKDRTAGNRPGSRPYGMLLVVDDVLLVQDLAGGLVGVDAGTGKQLWQVPGCLSGFNCPAPVKLEGKQYVACVNGSGEVRLLDHKTGKVFWTHALKSAHLAQPVFGDECLMVFEPHPKGDEVGKSIGKAPNSIGVLAGYRLSEKGAERAWVLPPQYMVALYLDCGPRRKMAARKGLIYHVCDLVGAGGKPSNSEQHLVIVREKDGRIVKEADVGGWNPCLWGDRLITVTDIQHRPRAANAEIWQMYNADPADFKALGTGWHVNGGTPVHTATGGYEVPVLEPFADGLFFCRVWGGIRAYDLRQPKP
jgi:outer membrane protein assembly factor BamB